MLSRWIAFAALLLLSGCAYDAGYYESNYASQPASVANYYSPVDYSAPPMPRTPYVDGPVMGGIYVYGDDRDEYGGPIFSPYHGIQCDRRRYICWSRNGPDYGWSYRFFGRRHAHWNNGNWNHGGGWNNGGGHGHGNHGGPNQGGPNQGGPNNDKPFVYKVPEEPDGSGTPTFLPNP